MRIINKLKPLPLLGWGEQLLGLCDSNGYLTQEVQATMPTQPSLASANGLGPDPEQWVYSYE